MPLLPLRPLQKLHPVVDMCHGLVHIPLSPTNIPQLDGAAPDPPSDIPKLDGAAPDPPTDIPHLVGAAPDLTSAVTPTLSVIQGLRSMHQKRNLNKS